MEFTFDIKSSLSPLVAWIWHTQSERQDTFISQAANYWEMVIWTYEGKTTLTVRGPETQASIADTPADADFLGIVFKPGVFMPHLPPNQLVNNALPLPDATAKKSVWLHNAVWQLPEYDNVDSFIQRMVNEDLLAHDPEVATAIEGHEANLSPRALQYRFLRATGLTQSTFKQIERARQAAELLKQSRSILDVVHETGYFDQAHMTRSLKRFMGQTPLQMMGAKPPE